MLIEFSVANYRSIKERVTLSMVAAKDDIFNNNTFVASGQSKLSLLKCVGIYGANASGKSNIVRALVFMEDFVRNSARKGQEGDPIDVTPFKLDAMTASQPSEFEVVFMIDDERYVYGFSADNKRVHEEWLTATKKKTRLLFKRSLEGIEFGDSWKGDKEKISQLTRPNALFISVAVQFNHPIARIVFDWFKSKVYPISNQPQFGNMYSVLLNITDEDNLANQLTEWLNVADFGIDHVTIEKTPIKTTQNNEISNLPAELREPLQTLIESLNSLSPDKPDSISSIKTWHKTQEGYDIKFDLINDESAGTNKFLALAMSWLKHIKNNRIIVIDELETSLHPKLTQFLIDIIHQADKTQLIFTTHDSSLLDSKLFRRDQIWFTEKDSGGATHLFSLWDYEVRKDENFRTGYLKGRYGAIPFIGELNFE